MKYDVVATQTYTWKYQVYADSKKEADIKAAQYFKNTDDGVTGVCDAFSLLNTNFDTILSKQQQNLSPKMSEVMKILKEHCEIIRYDGGFWSWSEVNLKLLYNGNQYMGKVPVWHCDVRTLRALQKRGLVKLDETLKFCILVN